MKDICRSSCTYSVTQEPTRLYMQGLICPSVTDLYQHDRSADEDGQVTTTPAKQCKCQSVRTLSTRLDGRGERLWLQTKVAKLDTNNRNGLVNRYKLWRLRRKVQHHFSLGARLIKYTTSQTGTFENQGMKRKATLFLLSASFDYFIYCVWTRFLEGESEKHPPIKSPESRSPTTPLLIWPILNLMAVGSLLVSFWRPRSGWLC